MNKFSIAYFGSSDFSADFLEKLLTDQSINRLVTVKFVVTQPDRPVGRKQVKTPTPVKTVAQKYGLEIFEIIPPSAGSRFGGKNLDLYLLYAYGAIIPKDLLTLPKYGFWCLHPSLLPKYRGTSPMATALINDDRETGVTIIKMDEKIDHGPIIAQEEYKILPTDKRPDLEIKLTDLAFEMFKKTVFIKDSLQIRPQNHAVATYSKKLTKQDGFIEFEELKKALNNVTMKQYNNETIYNLFRGLYPWPGIWTVLPNGKRLKITNLTTCLPAGKVKQFNNLTIESVQLEGKKEVDFETFKKAYKIF